MLEIDGPWEEKKSSWEFEPWHEIPFPTLNHQAWSLDVIDGVVWIFFILLLPIQYYFIDGVVWIFIIFITYSILPYWCFCMNIFQIIIMNSVLGDPMEKHGIVGECYGKRET